MDLLVLLLLGLWVVAVAACLVLIYREAHRQRRPPTLRLLYDRRAKPRVRMTDPSA